MTDQLELLIVEDNVAEAIWAQAEAAKHGLRNFTVSQNLVEALDVLSQKPKYVASDLFFPVGNIDSQPYVEMFLPDYEAFESTRFRTLEKGPVYHAASIVAEALGMSLEQYAEEFMPAVSKNFGEEYIEHVKDNIYLRQNHSRFLKYQDTKKAVQEGKSLPLGIVLSDIAKSHGIKSVIVTSTYHHDDAFEAVRDLVKVPYYDQMVGEGDQKRKNWEVGIDRLLKEY